MPVSCMEEVLVHALMRQLTLIVHEEDSHPTRSSAPAPGDEKAQGVIAHWIAS